MVGNMLTFLLGILIFGPLLFWMLTFIYTSYRGSPYVPIKTKRFKDITQFIKPGDHVADLGCGDGRVLIEAVRKGATLAEGWEMDALVFGLSKKNVATAKKQGLDTSKIKLHFGDFWNAKLQMVDVVYVYQMTKYMKPMKQKIISQLKKGCLVVSPDYTIPGMKEWKKVDDGDRGIYVYRI
jgi:SAM-dependent methyltransferase